MTLGGYLSGFLLGVGIGAVLFVAMWVGFNWWWNKDSETGTA